MSNNSTSLSLSSAVVVGTVAVDVVATDVATNVDVGTVVVVGMVTVDGGVDDEAVSVDVCTIPVDVGTVSVAGMVAVDVDVDVEAVDVEPGAVVASVTKSISSTWTETGGNIGMNPSVDCFLGLDFGYGFLFLQAST